MPSRRTFLATAGSGLLASAAGCLSPATDRDVSGSWTHVGRTPARSSLAPSAAGGTVCSDGPNGFGDSATISW
ncbi:hypothetical protein [Halogranum gelatinilyticum]|uniref:hypothetical protein n=1 Tax=Halogranum gelatinilyticum TaxID=660521 RepID=UPI000B7CBA2D|nr:hypothetical protein [Halogranum gelatinilyticum]